MPSLRFPEFDDIWENQQLGQMCDVLTGFPVAGEDIVEYETPTKLLRGINITEGSVRHSDELDRFHGGDTSKLDEYRLWAGDVVLGMDGSKVGRNVAIISDEDSNSILIQRVARLRAIDGDCLNFAFHAVFSFRFHRYVHRVKTSSGIPHISTKQIREYPIVSPTNVEQQKIADFLTAVDKRIEQLEEKKRLLSEYKKGVMQQIFSQHIRFKDDAGKAYPDWQEKRLGDVGDVVGGGTPETGNDAYWNGGINWFTPTEIKQKYVSKSMRTISTEGLKKSSAKRLPKGTLLLSSRATVGYVSIALEASTTNQGFQSIIVNQDNNNEFVYYWVLNNRKEFIRKASGSTFLEINKTEIQKLKIVLPQIEEQQKIADFLTSMDTKIEQVATQLAQAKTFKKGLLQQMFV